MSLESLSVKLRQLRGTMSLAEAAQRSQIPEYRLRLYEEGLRQPYTKTLKRLAETYGVPFSELAPNGSVPRGTRSAPVSPVRRRRRRRRAADPSGERSVEVPVEVRPGERVRIVIELIVRPAAGAPPAGSGASPAVQTPAPTIHVEARTAAAADPAPPAQPRPLDPPVTRPLWGPVRFAPGSGTARVEPPGHAAGARDPAADARDPLAEFRRAYGEFRRSRRS